MPPLVRHRPSSCSCSLTVSRTPITYRKTEFRGIKAINSEELIHSVISAFAGDAHQSREINFFREILQQSLNSVFDDPASKFTKTVVHRPDRKFYNSVIRQAKVVLERLIVGLHVGLHGLI